jgi:hypothetical protein
MVARALSRVAAIFGLEFFRSRRLPAWTECSAFRLEWFPTSRFQASPMDVAEWLRGLGLEQYAPAFRDNDTGRSCAG